jgi:hypothetical protein
MGICTDTEVAIPETIDGYKVTAIGEKAFADCTSITFIKIPETITTIGRRAFYRCTGITEITIPKSVTSIGTQIFYGCDKLTTVYYNGRYGNSENPFLNIKSIETVVFGGTKVSNYVLYNTPSIKTVVILDGVTSIGDYAFSGCSSLTSVTIGDSVTSIGYYAFSGCSSLQTVYYGGTASTWQGISIDSYGNESLTSATRYYYSETQPTTTGNYWHYVDGVPTKW